MAIGDFRAKVTARVIAAIEENNSLPGAMGSVAARPFNALTGAAYRGGNAANLAVAAALRGSDDPRWMTMNQANTAGLQVRRGAKAEHVEYWDMGIERSNTKAVKAAAPQQAEVADAVPVGEDGLPAAVAAEPSPEDDDVVPVPRLKPRVFFAQVFNGQDLIGLPMMRPTVLVHAGDVVDELIQATGAVIGGAIKPRRGSVVPARAAYRPEDDTIEVPAKSSFQNPASYYATVLREVARWTGAPGRLSRPGVGAEPGTVEHAREALRADMAAVAFTSMLGLRGRPLNQVESVPLWLEALRANKNEMFRAAKDAEAIVEHVLSYAPEIKAMLEGRHAANIAPKAQPRRPSLGFAELPDFGLDIPRPQLGSAVQVAAVAAPQGRGSNDPRWAAFESSLRAEGERYTISEGALASALAVAEPVFSDLQDGAARNGLGADDMSNMLVRQVVDEIRVNTARADRWAEFSALVRTASDGVLEPDVVAQGLDALFVRHQAALSAGQEAGLSQPEVDAAISAAVWGEAGPRRISAETVAGLLGVDEPAPVASLSAVDAVVLLRERKLLVQEATERASARISVGVADGSRLQREIDFIGAMSDADLAAKAAQRVARLGVVPPASLLADDHDLGGNPGAAEHYDPDDIFAVSGDGVSFDDDDQDLITPSSTAEVYDDELSFEP